MYDFLWKPRWIISHVLILVLIVSMIGLGFWQRSRWQEESAKQDRLESRAKADPVPLDRVVQSTDDPGAVSESVDYRRAEVTGTYDTAGEFAVRNRSFDGAPGGWVATPLVQADGTAVIVLRGWVPDESGNPSVPVAGADAPGGTVTVTGTVRRTQERGSVGATDPPTGTLTSLARLDLSRVAKQSAHPLEPVWIQADGSTPPQGDLPRFVDVDLPTPSQNLSYMMQWWIFTLIAIVGYPLVLRRVAHGSDRGDQVPMEDPPERPEPTGRAADAASRSEPPVASGA